MDEPQSDVLELGGSIALTGFSDLDKDKLSVVKKIVGNYARKYSEICSDFQQLKLTMKVIHKTEKSEKYELKSQLVCDKNTFNSEMTDRNLYFALDKVLKNLEESSKKS